jgi:hypothetical protein
MDSESCETFAISLSGGKVWFTFRKGSRKSEGFSYIRQLVNRRYQRKFTYLAGDFVYPVFPLNLLQFNPND